MVISSYDFSVLHYLCDMSFIAWTAYKRQTDEEWIITDWCYWAKDTPLAERDSMGSDLKYIDDYFYVQADKTVETPYVNKVRYAQKPVGMFRNIYA